MAKFVRHVVLWLGLSRSASSLYAPGDIDFDKVEIWPLSGGVADGVTVELRANKIVPGELAAIDFLTRDYEVAFRFMVDVDTQTISRNSALSGTWGTAETRGGFPFATTTAPLAIKFTKNPTAWAITVGGDKGDKERRLPWLDFRHRNSSNVVYAAVHVGFDDAIVFDRRLECSVACHPEECMDDKGMTTCEGGGPCFTRKSVKNAASFATCSNATKTGSMGETCCDGRELITIPLVIDASRVGQWVNIHNNSNMVTLACDSFGSSSDCAAAVGFKAKIESANSTSGMYKVWVPQLYEKAFAKAGADRIEFPPDVLAPKLANTKVLDIGDDTAFQFNLNTHQMPAQYYSLITQVNSPAANSGIEKWWFLNMFKVSKLGQVENWWLSHSALTYMKSVKQATITLYLTDTDADHTSCINDLNWTDANGASCAEYEKGQWCEDHGIATPAFVKETGKNNLDQLANSSGYFSAYTCCLCGGGFHAAPEQLQTILH